MRQYANQLILLLCIAGCFPGKTTAFGQEGVIEGEDKVETLLMLSRQMEANFKKIDTWSGVYDLNERLFTSNRPLADGTDSGPAWQVSAVVVPFTIDAKTDRVRADFIKEEPSKLVDCVTGETLPATFARREYRTISTPEHLLHSSTRYMGLQGPAQVVCRKASREAKYNQFHVNPLAFFGDGNRRFSETCSLYVRFLQGEWGEEVLTQVKNNTTLVRREVDGVTTYFLTIQKLNDNGSAARHVRTMVFSSAAGFNIVTYWAVSLGSPEVEMSWEYSKEGDVYLPSRIEKRRYDWATPREEDPQNADANLVSHRVFTLRESRVNRPVPPESFGLASLGLEYGNRVDDEIEGQLRFYNGEKLVAAEDFRHDREE